MLSKILGTGHERSRDVQPLCGMAFALRGTLAVGACALSENAKGACLHTPLLRHLGEPYKSAFDTPPVGGVRRAPSCSVRNFQGFEKDSSRSYAKLMLSWLVTG